MLRNRSTRKGFTLPEVLVTVAIVAVLAAVVVPAVTQQIGKGDDATLTGSAQSFRTAVTSFVADTRKFPGVIEDLFVRPAAADLDAFNNAYGQTAVDRWNGPYGVGGYVPADGLNMSLGTLEDSLIALTVLDGTDYPLVPIGTLTAFMTISGESNRLHVDSLLDKGTGNAAGEIRWAVSPGDTTLVIRLMPAR